MLRKSGSIFRKPDFYESVWIWLLTCDNTCEKLVLWTSDEGVRDENRRKKIIFTIDVVYSNVARSFWENFSSWVVM